MKTITICRWLLVEALWLLLDNVYCISLLISLSVNPRILFLSLKFKIDLLKTNEIKSLLTFRLGSSPFFSSLISLIIAAFCSRVNENLLEKSSSIKGIIITAGGRFLPVALPHRELLLVFSSKSCSEHKDRQRCKFFCVFRNLRANCDCDCEFSQSQRNRNRF